MIETTRTMTRMYTVMKYLITYSMDSLIIVMDLPPISLRKDSVSSSSNLGSSASTTIMNLSSPVFPNLGCSKHRVVVTGQSIQEKTCRIKYRKLKTNSKFVEDWEWINRTEVRFSTNNEGIIIGIHEPNNQHTGTKTSDSTGKCETGNFEPYPICCLIHEQAWACNIPRLNIPLREPCQLHRRSPFSGIKGSR